MSRFGKLIPAIISVLLLIFLLTLGIPFIQHARESARKHQWQNHYKSIGLAMHNFHDSHNTFRPGGIFRADGTPLQGWMWSITPFLDATPFYHMTVREDKPWDDPEILGYYMHNYYHQREFSCPNQEAFRGPMAVTHMAGNSWVLHRNSHVGLKSIEDSSNTMLVADACEPYEVFGSTYNWRDPELDRNSGPQSFGYCFKDVTFVLLADGRVIQVPLTENERWKRLRGKEAIRPDPDVTQRPAIPWELGNHPFKSRPRPRPGEPK